MSKQAHLYIILDTSTLVSEFNSNREAFSMISRLSSKGLLKIVVPDFVNREFTTRKEIEFQGRISKVATSIKDIERSWNNPIMSASLTGISQQISEIIAQYRFHANQKFRNWLEQCGVEQLAASQDILELAFKDYFLGNDPYKEIKSREDIPDSVIFQEILKFCSSTDSPIFIICGDKNLRVSLSRHISKEVRLFESCSDILDNQITKHLISLEIVNDNEKFNVAMIKRELLNHRSLIDSYLHPLIEEYFVDEIGFDSFYYSAKLNISPSQTGIYGERLEESVEYLGDGIFSIHFFGNIDFELEITMSYNDYASLSDSERENVNIFDIHEDRFTVGNRDVSFQFTSKIFIDFREQLTEKMYPSSEVALLIMRSEFTMEDTETIESYGLY